ncbi:MAG: hypothetical protein QHH43_10580 [Candidatus Saccharicenans sp.]|jgi:hypothetical protein|nr:hypothetical protein [Candidatus Saccharicenans sp.]MDH7576186.1 hypothetical protein [Candidatus Saccharicenans sp.]
MEELNPEQELRFIREMVERTRKITAGSWMFLLIWGFVPILGVIGMYILAALKKYSWIWPNWIFFVAAGIVFSLIYGPKIQRQTGIKTYAQKAAYSISVACALGFILAGFILPMLKLYPWGMIPVMMSLMAGVLIFSLGGLFEWALLKWCGALFWIGALVMVFIHENYRALLFVPLIIFGYIVPALVLRARYKKQS